MELTERGEFANESLKPSIILRMLNNLLNTILDDGWSEEAQPGFGFSERGYICKWLADGNPTPLDGSL